MSVLPPMPSPRTEAQRITFTCGECGTLLAATPEQQGLAAPCPRCGRTVFAPGGTKNREAHLAGTDPPAPIQPAPRPFARRHTASGAPATPAPAATTPPVAPTTSDARHPAGRGSRKLRIPVETGLDFQQLDRRESFHLARLLFAALAVAAICAAVVWLFRSKGGF